MERKGNSKKALKIIVWILAIAAIPQVGNEIFYRLPNIRRNASNSQYLERLGTNGLVLGSFPVGFMYRGDPKFLVDGKILDAQWDKSDPNKVIVTISKGSKITLNEFPVAQTSIMQR